jgi:hypothetical protein
MSKRIKVFWGIWFTALVFFSLSTFSFSEDSTPTAASVVYIQKPVVLSTASDGMLTWVKGNTFCFEEGATEFATMRPGQIFVTQADNGYIRSVKGISNSGKHWIIETEPAGLTDIFSSTGQFGFSGAVPITQNLHENAAGVTNREVTQKEIRNDLSGDGKDIIRGYRNSLFQDKSGHGTVWFTAYTVLEPAYTLTGEIKDLELKNLNFQISGQMEVLLELDAVEAIQATTGNVLIEKLTFAPIVFHIGIVPIKIAPTLDLYVGAEAGFSAKAGITAHQVYTFDLGVAYDGETWTPTTTLTAQPIKYTPELDSEINSKVWFNGVFGMKAMDSKLSINATPYARETADLDLLAQSLTWSLYAGVTSDVSFDLTIFKKELANWNDSIYSHEWLLDSGTEKKSASISMLYARSTDSSDSSTGAINTNTKNGGDASKGDPDYSTRLGDQMPLTQAPNSFNDDYSKWVGAQMPLTQAPGLYGDLAWVQYYNISSRQIWYTGHNSSDNDEANNLLSGTLGGVDIIYGSQHYLNQNDISNFQLGFYHTERPYNPYLNMNMTSYDLNTGAFTPFNIEMWVQGQPNEILKIVKGIYDMVKDVADIVEIALGDEFAVVKLVASAIKFESAVFTTATAVMTQAQVDAGPVDKNFLFTAIVAPGQAMDRVKQGHDYIGFSGVSSGSVPSIHGYLYPIWASPSGTGSSQNSNALSNALWVQVITDYCDCNSGKANVDPNNWLNCPQSLSSSADPNWFGNPSLVNTVHVIFMDWSQIPSDLQAALYMNEW